MPDVSLHGIDFRITGSATEASASVQRLTAQLTSLRTALTSTTSPAAKTAGALKEVGKSANKASSPLSNFASSLKRIAYYRFIRSILKSISKAFTEGLKNAYQFSKRINGDLAQALDSLAVKGLTLKNQMGAAFGGLLTAITPIVIAIINLITRLAAALSMLFAAFGGKSTYLKAKDAWTEWGDAAAGAGGAAKEALKYLAPFDELNVLPDEKSGGGGGGGTDVSDMFTEEELPPFLQRLSDLASSLAITINDIFFDWSDLTGEQIAEKVIAGLGGLLGAAVGFMIGGVPGAVVGTLVGVSISALISSAIFDHDGVLSKSEVAKMIKGALWGLCGGVIGFVVGGPGGALIGATVGLGIWGATQVVEFLKSNAGGTEESILHAIVDSLPILGAAIGLVVGGPAGAALGATVGYGLWMSFKKMLFNEGNPNVPEVLDGIVNALPVLGAAIGLQVGGPGGALLGATIGFGITLAIKKLVFGEKGGDDPKMTPTQFLHDVLGLPYDQEIIDWLQQGLDDIVDEISILFTGYDLEGAKQALLIYDDQVREKNMKWYEGFIEDVSNGWTLFKAWWNDNFVRGLQQAWIDAGNAVKGKVEEVVNGWIDTVNAVISKLPQFIRDKLGITEIPHVELPVTPDLDPPVGDLYKQAKEDMESASEESPAKVKWTVDEGTNHQPLIISVTLSTDYDSFKARLEELSESKPIQLSYDADEGIVQTIGGGANKPHISVTASVDNVETNSDGSLKTDFGTPWMKTLVWANGTYYKSDGALSTGFKQPYMNTYAWASGTYTHTDGSLSTGFSQPWMKVTAKVDTYTVSGSLTDAAGRMKVRTNAVIETTSNAVMNAKGGVYSGGQWHNIQQYASGGFARGSQLFWAREQGPELVGTLGGHTAVMNNDQIVASVSAGVARAIAGIRFQLQGVGSAAPVQTSGTDEDALYRAFRKALDETDFGGDIDLDGDALYRSVVRRNRQNTRATGVNQLAMA